jgi:cytosine/adenosine deaminase-related metal-dependent hydrolase
MTHQVPTEKHASSIPIIVRARVVVPMDGFPLLDGAVEIHGNRIAAVYPADRMPDFDGLAVIDLGDMALMPGLINAHCHLDYSILRQAILKPSSFTAWVQRINAIKRTLDADDYLRSIATGFAECVRWGTTTVLNIESFPELMPRMPRPPIRTWWFYEMIDVRHRITTDDVVAGALSFFQNRGGPIEHFGLSPHAPFTASVDLYRLAQDCAQAFTMPLTTHVAESNEEFAMFNDASGPLHDFLASIRRPMEDCGGTTPFSHLWTSGAIDARWILVHMNELNDDDFRLIASLPREGRPTIVHCPGTHAYFGRAPFAWRRLAKLGVNLCIGTDSLASTDSLSLLGELRRLWLCEPSLTAPELLASVTLNPAKALRRGKHLGRIAPGALADLIAVPVSGNLSTVCEEIVRCTSPIPWMMIDGQVRSTEPSFATA